MGRIEDHVGHYQRFSHRFNIHCDASVRVAQADRRGIDQNVDVFRYGVIAFPGNIARCDLDFVAEQIGQFLATLLGPIHDGDVRHAGQAEFHRDGPRRAARAQNDNSLAGHVRHAPQGIDEPLAIGILAHQLIVHAIDAVHRAHQLGRLAQFIQVLNHGHLVRDRKIRSTKTHRPQPAHGVLQVVGRHFERQVAPIQFGRDKRPFHHELGWVAGDGLPHAAHQLL